MIKVLHVSYSDSEGGAAIAAHRLHVALERYGVISKLAVLKKTTNATNVIEPTGFSGRIVNFTARAVSRCIRTFEILENPVLRSVNWASSGLAKWINNSDADIVNLHWIGAEFISLGEIASITKPIVWTLHDMWPFCGAEHYDDLQWPERYRKAYTAQSRPPNQQGMDINRWVFKRKQNLWKGLFFNLVSPSNWMAEVAMESTLFQGMVNRVIPNGLDLNAYIPYPMANARNSLGLTNDRHIVLFGASNSTEDRRKGFHLLVPALNCLTSNKNIKPVELVVFGASHGNHPELKLLTTPPRYLGQVTNTNQLAMIYSAADVFVAPSLQDNLPNTIIEALACGTPSAAFNVGGISDVILHGVTGCLANPCDPTSLSEAIAQTLSLPINETRMQCRMRAINEFSDVKMATRYIDYYESIIGKPKPYQIADSIPNQ